MSFAVVDSGVKYGEVHWGDHVVQEMSPRNYLQFDGGLMVAAEGLIRAFGALPHDRRWSADLTHYRWCCTPDAGPQTTLVAGAIEWDPAGDPVVFRVGSIPFSRQNLKGFLNWLVAQRPWEEGWCRPLSLTVEERRRFQAFKSFVEGGRSDNPVVRPT